MYGVGIILFVVVGLLEWVGVVIVVVFVVVVVVVGGMCVIMYV